MQTMWTSSGDNLYATLGLEKDCSQEDIKRAYKRMALQYHPDKNQNSPEATAKFQEINFAHSVLSNETKKSIYDRYGTMGLSLADQIGEDNVKAYMLLSSWWCKALMVTAVILTGCCCCLCCCCCCNCCCGKFKPYDDDDFDIPPDLDDETSSDNPAFNADRQADQPAGVFNISGAAVSEDQPIVSQPTAGGVSSTTGSAPIAMGYASTEDSQRSAIPMPYV